MPGFNNSSMQYLVLSVNAAVLVAAKPRGMKNEGLQVCKEVDWITGTCMPDPELKGLHPLFPGESFEKAVLPLQPGGSFSGMEFPAVSGGQGEPEKGTQHCKDKRKKRKAGQPGTGGEQHREQRAEWLQFFKGICIPVAETILTPHIPELEGRPKKNSHMSNKDLGWQNIGRHHSKMPHIKDSQKLWAQEGAMGPEQHRYKVKPPEGTAVSRSCRLLHPASCDPLHCRCSSPTSSPQPEQDMKEILVCGQLIVLKAFAVLDISGPKFVNPYYVKGKCAQN
ncbi:unnamed protein product [Ranitomeya imitator]|uniref:Uncharacterized protein n=1 Tax=Ranitomeya imitator TaxID=111125 RepID=A0ABN9LIE9_9NEOB|nr:unnamed protein product [Ranitomeya imitator]